VQLARLIEERYNLGSLAVHEPLEGGYANDVLRIEAGGSSYVVRVKYPPVVAESIVWEHELVERLALEIVPVPIRASNGATFFVHDRFAVSVLPYVSGRPAAPGDGPAVAHALGRVHEAAARVVLAQRPTVPALAEVEWPPARLPGHLERWLPTLEAAREWAIGWTRTLTAPSSPIHGDFFPGNVLVEDGRVTGVLDWEEARVDWPAIDLAAGVWHFAETEDFVDAYREAGGTVADDTLLPPLIRVKRVLEVLRAPTDRHVDWEYQLENLRAIERLPES
jgi:Ser/Thr protein kinase RdoA (MazF antagonist)